MLSKKELPARGIALCIPVRLSRVAGLRAKRWWQGDRIALRIPVSPEQRVDCPTIVIESPRANIKQKSEVKDFAPLPLGKVLEALSSG